jgi:hypothetical protein
MISLPRAARQCGPPSRDRGAFRRGSPDRAPSRAPAQSAAPVGRRAQPLHVFIDVRELRLDLPRTAFAGVCGRVRFHDFCRSMFQRALPWTARTSRTSGKPWSGRLPSVDRSSPFDRGNRRRYAGSGAEDHRASALPPGIAPARDFAPTLIASGSSRRGHCASPCPEAAKGDRQSRRRRATLARHGRRQGPGTPDLREEIRRAGARGAFRRKAVRERGWTVEGRSRSIVVSSAFFTAGEPCEGRSHGAGQPGLSIRETVSRPVID